MGSDSKSVPPGSTLIQLFGSLFTASSTSALHVLPKFTAFASRGIIFDNRGIVGKVVKSRLLTLTIQLAKEERQAVQIRER